MASSLLPELLEVIFYKLPVTSLIGIKWTCKKWHAIITCKRFIYNHLKDHSPERLMIRIHNHESVHIFDPVTEILTVLPIPDVFGYPTGIYSMLQCDGLMLCHRFDWSWKGTRNADLAVWNPVSGKIKWIEGSVKYRLTDYFGIGYDKTCRDNYKILRFTGPTHSSEDDDDGDDSVPPDEIYEFKSGSWRAPKGKYDWNWGLDTECRGVPVKGNMYWMAKNKKSFALSFDFSTETFKPICDFPPTLLEFATLASFNGEGLSLITQDEDYSIDIDVWVTNKLSDEVVSFTKYFTVTASPALPAFEFDGNLSNPGYYIYQHKSMMVWCDEDEVSEDGESYTRTSFYQINEGCVDQFETGIIYGQSDDSAPFMCGYLYVPSLVPVPE